MISLTPLGEIPPNSTGRRGLSPKSAARTPPPLPKPAENLIEPYEKAKRIYLLDFYDQLLLEAGGVGGDKRSAKILLCLWYYGQRLGFRQGAVANDLDISRKTFNVWLGKANAILQKRPGAGAPADVPHADMIQPRADALPAAPDDAADLP